MLSSMTQSGTTVVLISHRAKILRGAHHMLMLRSGTATFVEDCSALHDLASSTSAITLDVSPAPRAMSCRSIRLGAARGRGTYPTSCRRTLTVGWVVIGVLFGGLGTWRSWRR